MIYVFNFHSLTNILSFFFHHALFFISFICFSLASSPSLFLSPLFFSFLLPSFTFSFPITKFQCFNINNLTMKMCNIYWINYKQLTMFFRMVLTLGHVLQLIPPSIHPQPHFQIINKKLNINTSLFLLFSTNKNILLQN